MASTKEGRDLTVVLSQKKWWTTMLSQHGFDSEAFGRNPTDGSFAVLAFQLATFTRYQNEEFLTHDLRLLSQYQVHQYGKTNRLSHDGRSSAHVLD